MNVEAAASDFQRRFHISVDDSEAERNQVMSIQMILSILCQLYKEVIKFSNFTLMHVLNENLIKYSVRLNGQMKKNISKNYK